MHPRMEIGRRYKISFLPSPTILMPHLAAVRRERERQIAIEVSVADDDKWVEKREGGITGGKKHSSASIELCLQAERWK